MNNETMGPLIFLSDEELGTIRSLSKDKQIHLFISGYVDFIAQEVVLFRADETEMNIPLSWFQATKDLFPDFNKMEIINHGKTIKFGNYEISSTYILYSIDADYKKYSDTNRMIN